MWRLEALARHKPHIDQHQRRALRLDVCKIVSDAMKQRAGATGGVGGRASRRIACISMAHDVLVESSGSFLP